MKLPHFLLVSLVTLLTLSACVSTALPPLVIPEKKGELNLSTSLATNGLHVGAMYSPGEKWALSGKLLVNTSREIGFGIFAVDEDKRRMTGLQISRGFYSILNPFYGGTYGIAREWGDFYKIAGTINHASKKMGFTCNVSVIFGRHNGWCQHICNPFSNQEFSQFFLEPDLYWRFGKRRRALLFIGGNIPVSRISESFKAETSFRAGQARVGFGWNFKIF